MFGYIVRLHDSRRSIWKVSRWEMNRNNSVLYAKCNICMNFADVTRRFRFENYSNRDREEERRERKREREGERKRVKKRSRTGCDFAFASMVRVYMYVLLNASRKAPVIAHSPGFWENRFIEYERATGTFTTLLFFFMRGSNPSKCLRQIDNIAVARAADDRNALWRHQFEALLSRAVANYTSQW